jgi:tetratricopeptide (TPR) repeat protein
MKKILYIFILSLISISVSAQKESADVNSGNKLYKKGKFTEAEIAYRKGLLKNPKSFEATYNLGNALFKQKKYPDALEQYNNALALKPSEKKKIAAAFHNTGNSLLMDKKVEKSIKAYEQALKSNPKDNDTRYNLAYAQELLKQQKQQQKQQNKDNKDQNKDKKDQQKKDQQKKDQQNKDKQQQQQQQQQPQQPKMSKENAQQILDALQQDEKNAQDKAKKIPAARGTKKADKDW